ncbi:hypothetical protein ACW180_03285 [Limosilactobacillus fermentum]
MRDLETAFVGVRYDWEAINQKIDGGLGGPGLWDSSPRTKIVDAVSAGMRDH